MIINGVAPAADTLMYARVVIELDATQPKSVSARAQLWLPDEQASP